MERAEAIKIIKSATVYTPEEMEALETLIPELRESEDERIRKAILGLTYLDGIEPILTKCSITAGDIRAWLEKQKEQKPAEVDESTKRLNDNWMKQHFFEIIGAGFLSDDYEEQKPAEWSEKHIADIFEKVGLAKIAREQGNDELTNALQDAMLELSKMRNTEWSEEDKDYYDTIVSKLEIIGDDSGLSNNQIKFLREHCPSHCSNEWSEEDEKIIDTIVSVLGQYVDYKAVSGTGSGYATPRYNKEIDWLKSLRPSWKPSEVKEEPE